MDDAYKGLIQFSKQYNEALKALNLKTIDLMQDKAMRESLQSFAIAAKKATPRVDTSMPGIVSSLGKSFSKYDGDDQYLAKTMQTIANNYRQLFRNYEFTTLEKSTRLALEESQWTSIAQLCLSNETPMIHDAIACFANAKYEFLPDVISKSLTESTVSAADIS